MTQEPTYQYPQPKLRIAASYPATDGSRPESIDVEINDAEPASAEFVAAVVAALAKVAIGQQQQNLFDITETATAGAVTVTTHP